MRYRELTGAAALLLAVAGCGGEQPAETDQAATGEQEAPMPAATGGSMPNADYLAGEWCFEGTDVGGDLEEEQVTYIFNPDGTLLYQNNSMTEVDRPGTYEVTDEGLEIEPTFGAFSAFDQIATSENEMRISTMGAELVWTRGACD